MIQTLLVFCLFFRLYSGRKCFLYWLSDGEYVDEITILYCVSSHWWLQRVFLYRRTALVVIIFYFCRCVTAIDYCEQHPELVVVSYDHCTDHPLAATGVVQVWNTRFKKPTPELASYFPMLQII